MSENRDKFIEDSDLLFVFSGEYNDYYLGSDPKNIIIYQGRHLTKGKNEGKYKVEEHGYYMGARALLRGLHRLYSLENCSVLHKPEVLVGIESFVSIVEQIELEFLDKRK